MADIIDDANELVEQQQAAAFKRHAEKQHDPAAARFDGTHCVDCEEEVYPAKRLELGYIRCIDCAEWLEKNR